MDIKILDSHLREHLQTNAKPTDIARVLSLTSASIERVEKFGASTDFVYSVEITTNRPDMVSVRGIAREAATVLPQFGFSAKLLPLDLKVPKLETKDKLTIDIKNDPKLVYRICAVIMEVEMKDSPKYIKERLEAAGIRSLNNIIDVTNYIMLEMGHPSHVFDYDRLHTKRLIIRESKKGEKVVTLDKKEHTLLGGDIIADNGKGEIIDLLGVMGTLNSVVTNNTKRILFFLDNNDPWKIRKTSMGLAIRTEAAALNEKGVDAELAYNALLRGVEIYKKDANAKVASDIIDIYPKKNKPTTIKTTGKKISQSIGVEVPVKKSVEILKSLGFDVKGAGDVLYATPPTWREKDVTIEEDLVEEVARVYGYHNIPSKLPTFDRATYYHLDKSQFYWEQKIKNALRDWGFTEVYTYSLVAKNLLTNPLEKVVTLRNPLDEEHVYLRTGLSTSLAAVLQENKIMENVCIFELANVYKKQVKVLPKEILTLGILIKGKMQNGETVNFYHAKGIVEEVAVILGVKNLKFYEHLENKTGAYVNIGDEELGEITIFDNIDGKGVIVELNFDLLRTHANAKKTYTPLPKYPPVVEDITIVVEPNIKTGDIIDTIKKQSSLVNEVILSGTYQNSRTFHILYLDKNKNLTTEDVAKIREKITKILSEKFSAVVK